MPYTEKLGVLSHMPPALSSFCLRYAAATPSGQPYKHIHTYSTHLQSLSKWHPDSPYGAYEQLVSGPTPWEDGCKEEQNIDGFKEEFGIDTGNTSGMRV